MFKDIKQKFQKIENPYSLIFYAAIILSVFLILLTVGLYIFQFHGDLSSDSGEWADFGSYFSGITSPILNFLAIIIAIISFNFTLYHFNEQKKQNRIDSLYTLVYKIEKEIDDHIATMGDRFPSYTGAIQPRPLDEFKCVQLANMYKLLFNWLLRIAAIDKHDAVAIHIAQKQGSMVREMQRKRWFESIGDRNDTIANFFNTQSARLFRDDI